jgi:type VI secretion system protein ImpM
MAPAPFLFGKLPAHGDFVGRGIEETAQKVWDDWASGEITRSMETLGEDGFAAAHDHAAPLRFVAGPGALGPDWRAGAITPSIDAAGRRFVAVMGVAGLAPAEAAALGLFVAERCEEVLRTALIDSLDADECLAALALVSPTPAEMAAAAALAAELTSPGVWWRAPDGAIQSGPAPPGGLLATELAEFATAGEAA